jgi:D-beta-D-heptose 7-phosphate kinase/D-beta-D-heptose 1-phosphate adenosyltransferase
MSKILVVGDVILDYYIKGNYTKFSPEAPVPVLQCDEVTQTLGGAANVAANLQALGADYTAIFIIPDNLGSDEKDLLHALHNATYIESSNYGVTIKTRVSSSGQQLVRLDADNPKALSRTDENLYLSQIKHQVRTDKSLEYLVISDYRKNLFTDWLIYELMILASEEGIKVIVDTKSKNIEPFAGAYLITPNQLELNSIEKGYLADIDYCLTTKGKQGMTLTNSVGETIIDCTAIPVDNADVSGAGDTVLAAIADSLSKGIVIEEAIYVARIAAYLSVQKSGTAVVTKEDLAAAIDSGIYKIITKKELAIELKRIRKLGLKIAFTNGCFDVLHEGHFDVLDSMRKPNHGVVVAVDSNERVKQLKGPSRPINKERLKNIAAIDYIDAVIEFNSDEELLEIIKLCKPDLFVKGGDYKNKDIIGADFVLANGGTVKIVPRDKAISTTGILKK